MQIEIKCFATLSDFTPEGSMMTVEDGATIQQVIDSLGIKTEDVKIYDKTMKNCEKRL